MWPLRGGRSSAPHEPPLHHTVCEVIRFSAPTDGRRRAWLSVQDGFNKVFRSSAPTDGRRRVITMRVHRYRPSLFRSSAPTDGRRRTRRRPSREPTGPFRSSAPTDGRRRLSTINRGPRCTPLFRSSAPTDGRRRLVVVAEVFVGGVVPILGADRWPAPPAIASSPMRACVSFRSSAPTDGRRRAISALLYQPRYMFRSSAPREDRGDQGGDHAFRSSAPTDGRRRWHAPSPSGKVHGSDPRRRPMAGAAT